MNDFIRGSKDDRVKVRAGDYLTHDDMDEWAKAAFDYMRVLESEVFNLERELELVRKERDKYRGNPYDDCPYCKMKLSYERRLWNSSKHAHENRRLKALLELVEAAKDDENKVEDTKNA